MAAHLHSQGIEGDVADSAVLLVSELVTNAILHGEPPVELRVGVPGSLVHVEVHDSDRESHPHVGPVRGPASERLGGRGLSLVQELSSRWGLWEDDDGKCVWFEIDLR
jgi:anti-sigma regulatory factor (Ser/Thr protein kinase)